MKAARTPYSTEAAEVIALMADQYDMEADSIRESDKVEALRLNKVALKLRKQAKMVHINQAGAFRHKKIHLAHAAMKAQRDPRPAIVYEAPRELTALEKLQRNDRKWAEYLNADDYDPMEDLD